MRADKRKEDRAIGQKKYADQRSRVVVSVASSIHRHYRKRRITFETLELHFRLGEKQIQQRGIQEEQTTRPWARPERKM